MGEPPDLDTARALLGIGPDATPDAIRRAYLQKSYALIRSGAPADERERLKAAEELIVRQVGAAEQRQAAERTAAAREIRQQVAEEQALAEAQRQIAATEPELSRWDPRSFDSRFVNAVLPPAVAGAAVLIQQTPLAFFLSGFHVWIHEFGHATAAWLTGRRALPLPIGWTNVSPEKSHFVYFGILFLLAVLFVAGLRERKIVPMIAAVGLAVVQFFATWKLPDHRADLWFAFSGVGGEFYLSAAMMGLFYFRLPEKFRWDICRYLFLFLGAATFFKSWLLWHRIKRGQEGIPYGSMIHGEEDAGGDMNILRDDFAWTQREIIHTYHNLATACLVVLLALYVIFALRLDRVGRRLVSGPEE